MGKKGNWFSALKKAFTSSPKEKPTNVHHHLVAPPFPPPSHGHGREKKRWGAFGRASRPHAEPAAVMNIPLYREPSSIEKILGDAEMEQQQRQLYAAATTTTMAQYQVAPARPVTAAAPASLPSPPVAREREKPGGVALPLPPPSPPPLIRRFDHDREQQQKLQQMQSRAESEWRQQPQSQRRQRAVAARQRAPPPDRARAAAVAIQAAFRGYMARRNYRSLRGLIRLQGVMRGASVRRQTAQAMRCMQTLVRVQAHVRASRVEAMERRNRVMLRDGGRWRAGSQDGGLWDDSLLTPEEADARTKRKVEAVMKRERALAYAYSHQLLKATPMAAHAILADLQSGRNPWWWTPMDRRHEPDPTTKPRQSQPTAHRETVSTTTTAFTTAATTPARSVASSSYYSKPSRPARTTAKGVGSTAAPASIRDDESLTSCPSFGVPNYMTPTLSASAKARARAQLLQRQRQQQEKAAQEKPRFSFGLGQGIGTWAKSPFWKQQQPTPSRVATPAASVAGRHRPTRSIGALSVDSTVSMPAGIGRPLFK
ncbi:hypothetical protein QOZ80_1AG0042920 [Eleusine coracana subsp. coracana]|nr:hypothetical protein QOZ80_1AG0042920 [Eleusine coracana subsp. coracana]